MKHVLIVMMLLGSVILFAETILGKYQMLGTDYNIEYTIDGDVYIYVMEEGIFNKNPRIVLKLAQVADMRQFLTEVIDKQIEWEKTAKDNNITKFTKPMDSITKSPLIRLQWEFGDKWHTSQESVFLYAICSIDNELKGCALGIPQLTSISNQFISFDGGMIALFMDVKDLQALRDIMDIDSISKRINDEKKKLELFK